MMTLVITALASVVLSWGLSTVTSSRTALTGAIDSRMNRLQEALVVEDAQQVSSSTIRLWIRNTGSVLIVIDQAYVNNFKGTISTVCRPSDSPPVTPGSLCPTSASKLSLPIQAVGAIDVSGLSSVVATSGTSTSVPLTPFTTLTDSTKSWIANQWSNCGVSITGNTGSPQSRTISLNTPTQLTVTSAWSPNLDATSQYSITGICAGASYTLIAATTRGTTFQGSFTV